MSEAWLFLDVNRGRYLCSIHGGFCDSADNYAAQCPACSELARKGDVSINTIDRGLQILQNFQDRCRKELALIVSGLGVITAGQVVSSFLDATAPRTVSTSQAGLFAASASAILVSIYLYFRTFTNVSAIEDFKFARHQVEVWETSISGAIATAEAMHHYAIRMLSMSVAIAFLALLVPAYSDLFTIVKKLLLSCWSLIQ